VSDSDTGRASRLVVAAAVLDNLEHPTTLLCAARSYPPEHAGQFELPGGKIEEGEDAAAALEREIAEELGAHLRVALLPEGGQVVGDRHRPARRREQVQQHRPPALHDPRRGRPAEALLDPHRQHRPTRPAGHGRSR